MYQTNSHYSIPCKQKKDTPKRHVFNQRALSHIIFDFILQVFLIHKLFPIIEATSALFFTLSNKANKKISEFFDKLTLDSNTTHAMHMTKEISNSDVRNQLLVKLSLHLAEINEDKICKQTIEICSNSQNESSNQAD